jgi:F-type H+-transporting ATPase subunit delta
MQATDPVAVPYAEALVALAAERRGLAEIRDQVAALLDAFQREPVGLRVLESPRVGEEQKLRVIEQALRGRLEPALVDFLAVVVHRGRALHLRAICEEAVRQADVALGRVAAVMQVARPVEAAEQQAVAAALAKATGKDVVLEVQVREALVGGARIRLGDQVVDATVRTRLREMRRRLDGVRLTAAVFDDAGRPAREGSR